MTEIRQMRSNGPHDVLSMISSLFTKLENIRVTTIVETGAHLRQSQAFPDSLAKRVSIVHADGCSNEVIGAHEENQSAEVGGRGLQAVRPK